MTPISSRVCELQFSQMILTVSPATASFNDGKNNFFTMSNPEALQPCKPCGFMAASKASLSHRHSEKQDIMSDNNFKKIWNFQ
jgi:hypothetical protein